MSYAPTRRQILQGGSALLAAATLGLIRPNAAFAARDKIVVRVERDLGNLDPALIPRGAVSAEYAKVPARIQKELSEVK